MTINLYLITGNTGDELFKKKWMDLLRGDRMLDHYTQIYHKLYKFVNINEINRWLYRLIVNNWIYELWTIRAHIFSMYDFDKIKPHILDAAH